MSGYKTQIPPIKCQGIKSKLVTWIKAIVPSDFNGRWIEPFMGSGVVAFNVRPSEALLADSNPHLINFYQAITEGKITAASTRSFLEREGAKLLQSDGQHYYAIRERFNKEGDPLDFLFLNRAGFNGMIRFNKNGGFNVPFCHKPNRFAKAYITKICNQVQGIVDACALGNYKFQCQDYATTIKEASSGDILYCDPPYIGRHTDYFNTWNEEQEKQLAILLSETKAIFILSTWHSNEFRTNQYIDTIWSNYDIITREHFYHVGAKEDNRNPMLEALITNFNTHYEEKKEPVISQLSLLDMQAQHIIADKPSE
ncbi:MAG: Dam family site-specific DNA-(adenine-N6)-methyltransferase [Anaerolineaceae bacterium]|nr:Dam family site-specific DNA-(adenine-N6)-methyltransferase [Anaerolineaceae bacterium]